MAVRADSVAATGGPGMLSLVGTPIGNLADVSPRVLDTLRSADVVLCEDTRVTGRLLSRFDIHVPLRRCDENVLAGRIAPALARVAAGERVAFVSDAGMPGVSDPGQRLVDAALDAGLPIEVIPGPSAVTCALVASGLPMDRFFFEGFLPRRPAERRRRIETLAAIPAAVVVYESPHRVVATLAAVAQVMPGRPVALVRELTKVHEEVMRGPAAELARRVAERAAGEGLRGECVLVVAPGADELASRASVAAPGRETLDDAILAGLASGTPKSALARQLARRFGVSREDAYDRVVGVARGGRQGKTP